MLVGAAVDELQREPQIVAVATYRSLEYQRYVQGVGDLPQIAVRISIGLHRGAGDHAQATGPGERGEDLLVQAVGEVGVLGIGTQVGKGQHGKPGPLAERGPYQSLPSLLRACREDGAKRERDPERRDAPEWRGEGRRGDRQPVRR